MAQDRLRDLFRTILTTGGRSGETNASSTSAGSSSSPSSSTGSSLQRDLLFSFLRGSIDHSQSSEERRRHALSREEGRFSSSGRRNENSRMNHPRRYGFDEDDYFHNSRRGPRGFDDSDDESPERRFVDLPSSLRPQFRIREGRQYINIMEIFERSSFSLRRNGIVILIRGPSVCGISNLASLIVQKERALGNNRVCHLSTKDLYKEYPERYMMERYQETVLKTFKENLREGNYNFFVIEIEGSSLSAFRKLHYAASMYRQLNLYLIECMQPSEILSKYVRNRRDLSDVMKAIEEIKKEPPPDNILLMDATAIYDRDRMNERVTAIMQRGILRNNYGMAAHKLDEPKIEAAPSQFTDLKLSDDVSDLQTRVTELLNNPEFLKLVQAFGLIDIDPKAQIEPEFDFRVLNAMKRTRVFKPSKTIEYNHKPLSDPYDLINGFHPTKVFEYGHRTTEKLFELRAEIDIDEVIAQRKAKKIKSKENFYMNFVTNLDEIKSTQSYPSNWEVTESGRSEPIRKRKNNTDEKIKKILELQTTQDFK